MHEIIPQQLWLGNALDARNPRRLFELAIAAIVDLAREEPSAQLPRELAYCRFPLIDSGGNPRGLLAAAIQTTTVLVVRQVPTLVACSAGMSRSPAIVAAALAIVAAALAIVAAALAIVNDGTIERALAHVCNDRAHDLSGPLWQDVVAVYQELASGERR